MSELTAVACGAAGCTRPADPVLCAVDARRLGDWLAQLGGEFDALDAAPSMQGREPGTRGGVLASQRTPIRLEVAQLRGPRRADLDGTDVEAPSVLHVLGYWADAVREMRGLAEPGVYLPGWTIPFPARPTVATERKLLATHLGWICEQPAAGAFFDAIRLLYGRLRAANDGPRPRLLRCRRVVDGVECGGTIDVVEGTATCRSCGHTVSGLALLRAGAA